MEERIVIIDGNSLVNRAYYAIQRPMMTKDGLYTQEVYCWLSGGQKIRKDYRPTHMLVAYDRKAPTFRHIEYGEYKAGRRKMPLELAMELPVLKDVLEHTGGQCFIPDPKLGEDLAFCKRATACGYEIWCEPAVQVGHVGSITIWPGDEERLRGDIQNMEGKTLE